jgi:drug/metabolite transporter (DMT)-like permease
VAVSIATLGVVAVVYGGSTVSQPDKSLQETRANHSTQTRPSAPLFGDLLTLVASVSAGLYQVMYKKYVALPNDPEVASEGLYSPVPASEEPQASVGLEGSDMVDIVYPPPFGFHPNLLTSAIGLCTFAILWIPLPILHHFGIEPFSLPSNGTTVLAIAGIALGGVVFNAGFMVSGFTVQGIWNIFLMLSRFSLEYGVPSSPLLGICSP